MCFLVHASWSYQFRPCSCSKDDQDQREVTWPMPCQGRSVRRHARCRTTGIRGSSDAALIPCPGTCFRQTSVAKTPCLSTIIRAIAKEYRNVSYGKNLHIAVVVVFVVVVHGCERNARRQSVITAWHGGQSEWLSTCFFPVKDVVCYYLLLVPRDIIYA